MIESHVSQNGAKRAWSAAGVPGVVAVRAPSVKPDRKSAAPASSPTTAMASWSDPTPRRGCAPDPTVGTTGSTEVPSAGRSSPGRASSGGSGGVKLGPGVVIWTYLVR